MTTSDPLLRAAAAADVLVLGRADLQAAVGEAVAHGRLAAEDAAALVEELVRRGIPAPAAPAPALAIRAPAPFPGYDELTSAEVTERLDRLDSEQLRAVRDYERRNANRKSVLAAVAARIG
jgi:hypothetical protein